MTDPIDSTRYLPQRATVNPEQTERAKQAPLPTLNYATPQQLPPFGIRVRLIYECLFAAGTVLYFIAAYDFWIMSVTRAHPSNYFPLILQLSAAGCFLMGLVTTLLFDTARPAARTTIRAALLVGIILMFLEWVCPVVWR